MAGIKIVDLPALGRDLAATDLLELSLAGGTGSRKITGQEIINASKLNVGTTPIINGTAGRLLFQSTGNVLSQSGNLFWDNTNGRLGIGTSTPLSALGIVQTDAIITVRNTNATAYSGMNMYDDANNLVGSFAIGGTNASVPALAGNMLIGARTATGRLLIVGGPSATTFATMFSTGNLAINTTTDAGFKLDVNGTARIQGTTTLSDVATCLQGLRVNGGWTTFNASTIFGSSAQSGNTFNFATQYVGGATGTTNYFNFSGTLASGTGGSFNVFNVQQTFSNTNSSQTFRGFYYNPNITGLQAGTTHRAIETTTGDVLLGTTSGNVGIGTSSPLQRLHVNGNGIFGPGTAGTSYIQFSDGSVSGRLNRITFNDFDGGTSTRGGWIEIGVYNGQIRYGSYNQFFIGSSLKPYRFFMKDGTDNVIISNGTAVPTDSGYLFDVQGTARVSGILTIGDNVQGKISADNQYLNLYHNGGTLQIISFGFGSSIGASGYLRINQNAGDPAGTTSGTIHRYDFNSTITNSTGTAQWNFQSLRPNYNFTGTYSGTVRGFYYNPTLTSMTGVTHFAFHSTSGRVRFEGLPTSPTGLNAGDLWNDAGTLKIV